LLALFICILFHFLFSFISSNAGGWIADVFGALSMSRHFESISRGVIDTKDLIYFLSVTVLGLFLAEFMVSKRK
jgi:ABC-2 type transport system permease protein